MEHFDVLVMGAGLSGINAAHHPQEMYPKKRYLIIEQRERIGGTWDLFRYPGVRSDSDMFTMGCTFRPWTGAKAISPGNEIREYICTVARDEGIDDTSVFIIRLGALHGHPKRRCGPSKRSIIPRTTCARL